MDVRLERETKEYLAEFPLEEGEDPEVAFFELDLPGEWQELVDEGWRGTPPTSFVTHTTVTDAGRETVGRTTVTFYRDPSVIKTDRSCEEGT